MRDEVHDLALALHVTRHGDHPGREDVFWQYVIIPPYQAIATSVGQIFASALTGNTSVDDALKQAQHVTLREMTQAGYDK